MNAYDQEVDDEQRVRHHRSMAQRFPKLTRSR
jgi:hypothetical protein